MNGTFDLSHCGDAGKYLSISTGYRRGKNPKNAIKAEIWVCPRFLIAKELDTTAAHFKPIMDNWQQEQAPIGLFWTLGSWNRMDWYNYLTTENPDNLSKTNLYENWKAAPRSDFVGGVSSRIRREELRDKGLSSFIFHF